MTFARNSAVALGGRDSGLSGAANFVLLSDLLSSVPMPSAVLGLVHSPVQHRQFVHAHSHNLHARMGSDFATSAAVWTDQSILPGIAAW